MATWGEVRFTRNAARPKVLTQAAPDPVILSESAAGAVREPPLRAPVKLLRGHHSERSV